MYSLDERFLAANTPITSWPLSEVLLANNAHYAWFLLVPRVAGATELLDLSDAQQRQLLHESNTLSRWILAYFGSDKLNVAMLGNMVNTLHIHHIGRKIGDAAWPGPVWNHPDSSDYTAAQLAAISAAVKALAVDTVPAMAEH